MPGVLYRDNSITVTYFVLYFYTPGNVSLVSENEYMCLSRAYLVGRALGKILCTPLSFGRFF